MINNKLENYVRMSLTHNGHFNIKYNVKVASMVFQRKWIAVMFTKQNQLTIIQMAVVSCE